MRIHESPGAKRIHTRVISLCLVALLAGLINCGTVDESTCAIAFEHLGSCFPGTPAVEYPVCDAQAEEAALRILELDCNGIKAMMNSGKADSFWGYLCDLAEDFPGYLKDLAEDFPGYLKDLEVPGD